MATMTDEEKAAAILGEVEGESPAEPTEPVTPEPESPEKPDTAESTEEEPEEEKPTEGEEPVEEPADTLKKQFPNLKGETLEEYVPELEKAYDNSFKEALRLNDLIKEKDKIIADNTAIVERANEIIAGQPQNPDQPENPTPPPLPPPTQVAPEIEWIREERRRVMLEAFDKFKVDYPQVLDQENFEKFRLATDGVKAALTTSLGRPPSDAEILKATAGAMGWQPDKKRNDAAIKENASSHRTQGSQSPVPSKPAKVSDAEVEIYQKLFSGKTREDAIKELSEVK